METPGYQTAQLLEIQAETADTSSYLLALEGEREIQYFPGQFNMLGVLGSEEAAISYSSLAVVGSNRFTHTIRRVGNITRLIGEMEVGRKLLIRGPFGRGWPVEELLGQDLLMVAGGIGLAPLRPLLLYAWQNRNQLRKIVLIYGARTPEDMIFQKDLAAWQSSAEVKTILCVDQLTKESHLNPQVGLVTQFLEGLDLDYDHTIACLCGPEIMMRFVANNLILQGYAEGRIYLSMERRMRCGTAHCGHCQIGPKFVCQDGPVFSYPDLKCLADTLL